MAGIGIVGTGISGLHLALRLQQLDVESTLYAERVPEPRVSRLANIVVRFEQTCARERALRVNHREFTDFGLSYVHLSQHGDPSLSFCGALSRPASSVDFRVYLPQLLEDYEHRGGRVVPTTVDAPRWCASRVITT